MDLLEARASGYQPSCCLTSKPPARVVRCLTKDLREGSGVEGPVDPWCDGRGFGEREPFELGGESVDLTLELAWLELVAGAGESPFLGRGDDSRRDGRW